MLDIGFIHALRKIVPYLNNDRQTQLFSATMSKQMENLSRVYLTNPQKIQVTPPGATADQITQTVRFVEKPGKPGMLRDILNAHRDVSALVFARTKHGAEKLKNGLVADGYAAESVHGNKSQGQRDRALKHFRAGDMKVLVATDVAARGIDIPSVGLVVNYDLPDVPENYVHRIGRTARAGRSGVAVTLCAGEEAKLLRAIEKLIKIRIQPEGDSPKFAPPAPADAKQGKPKRHKPRGNPNTGEHKPQRPNAQKTRRPKRRKPNKAA
jgi:ATP-dependent RNA helicase RhlE